MHLPAIETDLYQLTMAQGYWKLGRHLDEATFLLFFRENPFGGGYAIHSGLENVVRFVEAFQFTDSDIEYLARLKGENDISLFDPSFLELLKKIRMTVNIDAIPEGRVVFANEPIIRVQGPLWQCQLLETGLLTLTNFATLIATKASRVCFAAQNDPVIEFGMRRAQGADGALTASRSSFVGGAFATSNTLAGKLYHIPVKGTHAHSWIMAFNTEEESFSSYADVFPQNCLLLIDTYSTVKGIEHAIEVGKRMKEIGHHFLGVRLDSGDLVALSQIVKKRLNEEGFNDAIVLGSGDLDEYVIADLKEKGAKIDMWGVGTRMITGYDQPALGGVYKLSSIKNKMGEWISKFKTSDDVKKKTLAGVLGVRRVYSGEYMARDEIFEVTETKAAHAAETENSAIKANENLLIPIFRQGKLVYALPTLIDIQKTAQEDLKKLSPLIRVLKPKEQYEVIKT